MMVPRLFDVSQANLALLAARVRPFLGALAIVPTRLLLGMGRASGTGTVGPAGLGLPGGHAAAQLVRAAPVR